MSADLLIHSIGLLATCAGAGSPDERLGLVPRAAVLCRDGLVAYAGPERGLPEVPPEIARIDARGELVTPGFVDAHTHLVFAGERSRELALRCAGATYLEIAQAGGGIASTVRATRAASEDELVRLARPRLRRLLAQGVTTAEAKSGYGLTLADELKMLRAIARLDREGPIQLVPTLLAAHAVPPEHHADREAYIRLCTEEIVPAAAETGLARFCDAFVEEGAFTAREARTLLEAGARHGLVPRLHADQLSSGGGAELAASLAAATADHLEHVSDAGIEALARGKVSAVLVPTSTWYLRQLQFAPGRRLADAGVNLALGTNVNPGSAMSENLALALTLACLSNGLTPAEALLAATAGAAAALRLEDRGRIALGLRADLVVHACAAPEHLAYHAAESHARVVVIGGDVALERDLEGCGA